MSRGNPKPQYKVLPLNPSDMNMPWLFETPKEYKTGLPVFQRSMGDRYAVLENCVQKLLDQIPEERHISRILPRNERALSYFVSIKVNEKTSNYVLILGAEASTKTKGMNYSDGQDHYQFSNSFFVLGSKEPMNEDKFGKPTGLREVKNRPFQIYDCNRESIQQLAINLAKVILTREKIVLD